ncbi:hypothetical protein DJ568_15320 [Mucilaginibacter hurinus]|uniref:Uncharacterized protein n=1 Tax=Mucilaginibacter hurinus TaxID=2201324 RepID=A0A367GKA2_9SPHI|nr:hypothetical protein [Mucilaginibacter hurinus]RCH53907.1 hypothetical protein DJ568_15320 [Mucilaginibacter hurinus]
MSKDPLSASLFEMRLEEIYRRHGWLRYEISLRDFVNLFFPLRYKQGVALRPEQPASFGLDREIYLQVLVAFKQSFNAA